MDLSTIANAHEFAGRPPPTAEDYQRLDKTLNKIFNKEVPEMTEPTITIDQLEELAEQTSVVASELLKQDGWAILTQMQKALLQGINSTGLVLIPVLGNKADVLAKVSDPVGLDKILETLRLDITNVSAALKLLSVQHEGKKGEPEPADLLLIDKVSQGYSDLQGHLERAIQPLILQVVDILEAAGIHELEIKKDA